ncbi:BnaA02g09310D [Brassica napus]|uniref:BnaA02g09310D protein n=1 Tax=Brassica napus TaxID=3708 RepID=A0A078G5Q1_BRANA|nr:BnaA02g09310D [Brassica napus]
MGAGCSQLLSDMQSFKAANPGCILEDFYHCTRMQKEDNLWSDLWETAKPLPAVKQTPLYDEDLVVEGILNSLEDIPSAELFEQLFVSLVALGFVMVEPVVATNECKEYVYETVETMLKRPEEVLRSMKQTTEESPSSGNETKRRFKRLGFIFRDREGNQKRVPSETEQKSREPSPRQSFSSLFDGKSSLFAKTPPRPDNGTQI